MVRRDMRRDTSRWAALAFAALLAWPSPAAHARVDDRGRPWARGTLMPTFGLGLAFSRDVTQLGFGLGFNYYVINGLAFGLGVSDTVLIYGSSLRSELPGVEKQIPTNLFEVTPRIQYVFFRSRWFSPYAYAGVGPSVFNHGGGTHGHWVAGPGAYIGIAGPVFLDIGVGFSGMFPRERCNDAFIYEGPTASGRVFDNFCGFSWGPRIGIVLAFGAGKPARKRPPPPPPSRPIDPLPEGAPAVPAPTEPTPIEPPSEPAPQEQPIGPELPPEEAKPGEPGPADPAPEPVVPDEPPPPVGSPEPG